MMKRTLFGGVAIAVGTVLAAPMLDDTPTRVQTTLDPGLVCVGTLKPKAVGEVSASRWTLDCAGTDRENCDWRAMREYVAPLGIPRIRVQGGWARCEKDLGLYDFAWLDRIVFDAKKFGVSVWLELSYGNPAYPGGGGRTLFGGFPSSPEGLAAWDRWVERMAKRYRGTVRDWCVWNEPDGNIKNDPVTATAFAIRTAEIVKREIPDARVSAFALSQAKIEFVRPFVDELVRLGKVRLFDNIAYHGYRLNPDTGMELADECRAFLAKAAPSLKLFEGEGGTQSEWCGAGALHGYRWTELKQAKFDLRRSLGDLALGDDTSVFHLCDIEYRTQLFHDGLLRYGLLKTQGQLEDYRVLKVKMAYYAIQNAVSVFNDALECLDRKTTSTVAGLKKGRVCDWRDRKTATPLVVFWEGADVPSDDNQVTAVEVKVKAAPFKTPVWCDVLSGNVYRIHRRSVRREGDTTVYAVPAYDSPAFVTDLSLLDIEKSWEVRFNELHELPENITIFEEAEFYGPFSRTAKIRTVAEAKAAGVPHRTVRLDPRSHFDLAPLTDRIRVQEEADVAGLLVVRYRSPVAKKVVFAECNDWYGGVSVNGIVQHADVRGRDDWMKYDIMLDVGENEIAFWTAPGLSGRWWAALAVGECE